MVFPHEHILVRFNGHFGASTTITDKWSVGMHFGLPNLAPVYDPAKLQTFVNACQAAANTFHGAAGTLAGTNCFIDYVSGAQLGVLGNYVPTTQVTVLSPTTTVAGGGTTNAPWNSSNVLSLRTAQPRGRGSNGRLYWPMTSVTITASTGRIPEIGRAHV